MNYFNKLMEVTKWLSKGGECLDSEGDRVRLVRNNKDNGHLLEFFSTSRQTWEINDYTPNNLIKFTVSKPIKTKWVVVRVQDETIHFGQVYDNEEEAKSHAEADIDLQAIKIELEVELPEDSVSSGVQGTTNGEGNGFYGNYQGSYW